MIPFDDYRMLLWRTWVKEKQSFEMNMTKEYLTKESYNTGASLVAQTVKNLPAVQETWVQSLVQEDPLEKEMATHSSIPAWRTGRPQSMGP